MQKVCVVGAGAVGTVIALACQDERFDVTVVADQWPGEGITTDLAAGIGLVFRATELVEELVVESYPEWMAEAEDPSCPAVRPTTLRQIIRAADPDPPWAWKVRGFERVRPDTAVYETYAFDPEALGRKRVARIQEAGGTLERRPLAAEEITHLLEGKSILGYDYTIDATGLRLRSRRPTLGLYPVRGVLVRFQESPDRCSDSDGEACLYRISRPGGVVLGGTYDRFVETCSASEQEAIGRQIVDRVNVRFGLNFDFADRTRITVGYRPCVPGEVILEFGPEVGYVNGFGGQGLVTGPALSRRVARTVRARIGGR